MVAYRIGALVILLLGVATPMHGTAVSKPGGDCQFGTSTSVSFFGVAGDCVESPGPRPRPDDPSAPTLPVFEPACDSNASPADLEACLTYFLCPEGEEPWGVVIEGALVASDIQCRPITPSTTITPASVARAFARIPLPALRSQAQPAARTLVNLDTIFSVPAQRLDRTVSLLGQRVDLDISPSYFDWEFGDGQLTRTRTPGARYPSRAITHRYERAGVVEHRVSVTWTARWRVAGGAWQDVPGQVVTPGPPTRLEVREAIPNLAGPGRSSSVG